MHSDEGLMIPAPPLCGRGWLARLGERVGGDSLPVGINEVI